MNPCLSNFLCRTQTYPTLVGFSAMSLGPKLDFFREELGASREEIREAFVSNPTVFK